MTKNEVLTRLESAVGDNAYGKEVLSELKADYNEDDKKYGQTIKDRLDDRLGSERGWLYKDIKNDSGNPKQRVENIEVLEAMLKALA